MMKKTYVKADLMVCKMEPCSLLAASEYVSGSTKPLEDDDDFSGALPRRALLPMSDLGSARTVNR